MKTLLRFLLLSILAPSVLLAQTMNPIGIDTTSGQQKVNTTVTVQNSGSGSFVDTGSIQTITGAKTFNTATHIFSGADTLRIPTSAPAVTSGNMGLSSGILQIGDGTAARSYLRLDNAQTVSGSKTFTANQNFHSGNDALFYSDAGTTLKAGVFADSGHIVGALTQSGELTNCGISVSGSTFTIAGYDGTALSATNPCVVAIRSSTAGRVAIAYFTANVTFTFGAASDTDGNLFGITDADWANTMPFFLGVIFDGTTPHFVISRVPLAQSGAAATDICQKADIDCDAQSDALILTTGLTLASWVNLPVTQLGWFTMTYATTGSAWTATVGTKTGFNDGYKKERFTFPVAQNGAAASTHLRANGGTAPVFSVIVYQYGITPDGIVNAWVDMSGDGGADGAGAVNSQVTMPYSLTTAGSPIIGRGSTLHTGATAASTFNADGGVGLLYFQMGEDINDAALENVTNAAYSAGGRDIRAGISYSVF